MGECGDKYCGLLLEERLHYDSSHSSVVSTDSRWRRGCTSDGREMTDNSEASNAQYNAEQGCQQVAQRSEDRLVVRHTLCLCNTTLCNTHKNDMSGASIFTPALIWAIMPCIYALLQLVQW